MFFKPMLIVLMVLAGASAVAAVEDESVQLSVYLSESLAKFAARGNAESKFTIANDGKVLIKEHALRIVPVSERTGETKGKFFAAARFEVLLDGSKQDRLTFGSVGIGDSPQGARETAVNEWYISFGGALFNALAGVERALTLDDYRVHAGFMGMRGQAREGWLDGSEDMNRKLLSALAASLPKADTALHTLDLKFAVRPDGGVEGECRFDGKPAIEILTALKKLEWPATASGYLFKQAYVLTAADIP